MAWRANEMTSCSASITVRLLYGMSWKGVKSTLEILLCCRAVMTCCAATAAAETLLSC